MASLPPSRLLVVDDNADNRDVLTRRLRRIGHSRIDTAEDGRAALAAIARAHAAEAPYDAVLLDVMMPVMNGVEVLEALAADAALAATPVIMISAATEIDTVVRCVELGAEDYLAKPFNPASVARPPRHRAGEETPARRGGAPAATAGTRTGGAARQQQLSMLPDAFSNARSGASGGGARRDAAGARGGWRSLTIVSKSQRGSCAWRSATSPARACRPRCSWRAPAACCALHGAARGRDGQRAAGFIRGAPRARTRLSCKNNPTAMFVTLFLGFLDIASGGLAFVNAGHPPPFRLFWRCGLRDWRRKPEAAPLGIVPGLRLRRSCGGARAGRGAGDDHRTDCRNDRCGGRILFDGAGGGDLEALRSAMPEAITATLTAKMCWRSRSVAPVADDVTALAVRRL